VLLKNHVYHNRYFNKHNLSSTLEATYSKHFPDDLSLYFFTLI